MEKCPSYRGVRTIVRLIEDFYDRHTYVLPGHVKVFVLERCPSYEITVLRGFTVVYYFDENISRWSNCSDPIFLGCPAAHSFHDQSILS